MDYTSLRFMKSSNDRTRIIDGLGRLRKALKTGNEAVPEKGPGRFLLASWNIRKLSKDRSDDAIYFISEIISRFDVVAVQEVMSDLTDLKRILRRLGDGWDVIYTDVNLQEGGTYERLAFLYDSKSVSFMGLAGELVLPEDKDGKMRSQLARSPFICGFQSGWSRFNLCTVHIFFGTGGDNNAARVYEIERLAKHLSDKAKFYVDIAKKENYLPESLILLGDFNIGKREDRAGSGNLHSGDKWIFCLNAGHIGREQE